MKHTTKNSLPFWTRKLVHCKNLGDKSDKKVIKVIKVINLIKTINLKNAIKVKKIIQQHQSIEQLMFE